MKSDPLFVGLTRPTLFLGVSMEFAMLNMLVSIVMFIQKSDFRILPIAALIHAVGYILTFKEPRFMKLYLTKFQNFNKCPNKSFYGANSYKV